MLRSRLLKMGRSLPSRENRNSRAFNGKRLRILSSFLWQSGEGSCTDEMIEGRRPDPVELQRRVERG